MFIHVEEDEGLPSPSYPLNGFEVSILDLGPKLTKTGFGYAKRRKETKSGQGKQKPSSLTGGRLRPNHW